MAAEPTPAVPVVSVRDVAIQFGAVRALDGVSLDIHSGEAIGLIGHNGAGKSTIVNVINGLLHPHEGALRYGATQGGQISPTRRAALMRAAGLRCVYQELSLCSNLTIAENVRLLHPAIKGWGWRGRAAQMVRDKLDQIFPNHGIDCSRQIAELSIAKRQMTEIAIAFLDIPHAPKLVILDEPTSSLDASLAAQLLDHVRRFVAAGGAVILISHMLNEILAVATRIVVMKDGKLTLDRQARGLRAQDLVDAMGSVGAHGGSGSAQARDGGQSTRNLVLDLPPVRGGNIGFTARKGEIIGLAGLAGHGQTDMLVALYKDRVSSWLPQKAQRFAFVAGDRGLNGVFPLWSILRNLSITELGGLTAKSGVDTARERHFGESWKARMGVRTPDMDLPILSLSGGNQQKVLFARALATKAQVVLMDDPMRGVDVGTKNDVYDIIRHEAQLGRTFLWYSTEIDEVCQCDRVYVFLEGRIVAELQGADITEEAILAASFTGVGA